MMSSNLDIDIFGTHIVKNKTAFCEDASCKATIIEDLSAKFNVPGLAGMWEIHYKKIKSPEGKCDKRYRVGMQIADLCIGDVLSVKGVLGFEIQDNAGDLSSSVVGNASMSAKTPLLSIAANIDEIGLTPISITTKNGKTFGPISKERTIGGGQLITWDEMETRCRPTLDKLKSQICKK